MYEFITYQLKAAIIMIPFFAVWFIFLKNNTFHQLNRLYLLISLICSFVIPLISLNFEFNTEKGISKYILNPITTFGDQVVYKEAIEIGILEILNIIYFTISIILTVILSIKFIKIYTLFKKSKRITMNGFQVISTNKEISPFAFLNYIFLNEKNIENNKLDKIIFHEAVHIKQKHTVDLILLEIISIFQWFNPIIYLYKRSLKTTHEYLSDEKIIEQGFDSDEYQLLLLKQKIGVQPGFANNFNKSLTLKRITMMNQQKSKSISKLKVLLAIPVLLMSLIIFSSNITYKSSETFLPSNNVTNDTILPEYPGGNFELQNFIVNNIKYPEDAVKNKYEDVVYVQFTVTETGKVTNIETIKGKYEILKAEAIRIVGSLKDFNPGTINGKKVEMKMVIPIVFKLSEK